MSIGRPRAEVDIDSELITALLLEQHPIWPTGRATRLRAHGWALALRLAYLSGSADDPVIADIGRRTLAAVLDPTPGNPGEDIGRDLTGSEA